MPDIAWPPRSLSLLEAGLRELRDAVAADDQYRELTEEQKIWLTRFLVVRATGYLEQVFFDCTREHLRAGSNGSVQSFVMSFMDRSQNPSPDNLKTMFKRLDAGLSQELRNYLDEGDGGRRRELDSLVRARHSVAHGLNESIRRDRAIEWTALAIEMADWIILTLNPSRV